MARKAKNLRSLPMYKRVFFDRTLLVGIIFLCLAYITRGSWGSPFAEAAAIMIGVVWSTRAATTNPQRVFRLAAVLVLMLLGVLLALKLGMADGLL
jgi:Mg2+/citrate symporter